MSVFGAILDGDYVERVVEDMLKKWLPTYLAEMERQRDIEVGHIARPRTWTSAPTFGKYREDQLPLVLIVSAGLAGNPERHGDGEYIVPWAMGIAIVTAGPEAPKLAKIYVAAVRAALLQHKSLGGTAEDLVWEEERYDNIPRERQKVLSAGQAVFTARFKGAVNDLAGPAAPDPQDPATDPWPDDPLIQTADVTIEKEDDT